MLKRKDLKVGALIWWAVNDDYRAWSCPCVITYVSRKNYRVKSLDDFKETSDLRIGNGIDGSSLEDMRICTIDEVERFFREQDRKMTNRLRELEDQASDYKAKKDRFDKLSQELLSSFSK